MNALRLDTRHRRTPEQTALYRVLAEHLETFLDRVAQHESRTLPRFVERELRGDRAGDAALLREGYELSVESLGPDHALSQDCARSAAELYGGWDRAAPEKGHGEKAAEWKAKVGAGKQRRIAR